MKNYHSRKGKIYSISGPECTEAFLQEAFDLYSKYYQNISRDTFFSDMKAVHKIFYIRAKDQDETLGGFLAQRLLSLDNGQTMVFCGSKTVVDKQYWGTPMSQQLQIAWIKEGLMSALLYPWRDVYFYAAPTGYKTYLIFMKNFLKRWPAYDSKEKQMAPIIDQISRMLYQEAYKPAEGLVYFGAEYIITDNDARVTETTRREDPHIDFFERMNPGWREAKGLPLLVKVDLQSLCYSLYKKLSKIVRFK